MDEKTFKKQEEAMNNYYKKQAATLVGTTMTQKDIQTQQRAAELSKTLNQFYSGTGKERAYDPDAKITMPVTNDGKLDVGKLKQLNLNDKQIATIKANYNNNMTAENKKAIHDVIYASTKSARKSCQIK